MSLTRLEWSAAHLKEWYGWMRAYRRRVAMKRRLIDNISLSAGIEKRIGKIRSARGIADIWLGRPPTPAKAGDR
jgi:hypothetical protein